MKSYTGNVIYIEGRGNVLIAQVEESDPLPEKGETALINGQPKLIRDVEVAFYGDLGRNEAVGIVFRNL